MTFLKTVSLPCRYQISEVNCPRSSKFLAMITKKELLEGLELLYTGKAFAGFQEENPFVTFLRFDKRNWSKIWVKYGGRAIVTRLKDVRLTAEGNLAV
jgi:hypothetical protein